MSIDAKELTPLKAQVSKLENQAEEVQIETNEDYKLAVDLVARLKDTGSKIKKVKESITKPLNEALRNARELFKPLEVQFSEAETTIKTKLLDYKKKIDEEARVKEAKIAKRVESGSMKLETAENKIEDIDRVDNTTRGKIGEVQVRTIRKVRIIDEKLLPREYLVPNDVLIRKDALGGKDISGVVVEEEEIIAAMNI